jgi:hypothetical protein
MANRGCLNDMVCKNTVLASGKGLYTSVINNSLNSYPQDYELTGDVRKSKDQDQETQGKEPLIHKKGCRPTFEALNTIHWFS